MINLFTPQQKLISKTRVGAKVSKKYDKAQTPYQRLLGHPVALDDIDARRLAQLLQDTNPAEARRQVANLCATLLERVRRKTVTTRAKANRVYLGKTKQPPPKRANSDEATTQAERAS